ncbi:uncharacterized protein LOC131239996 [Magnolia sinica]|uniref:uncharacterized protein LOC131239996 n=1 Tax=Magnolia sinica TaxID=86752 RepID=UPI00265A0149|nr:uncharacterized protein LOC131239996 [Magnolia sinica]
MEVATESDGSFPAMEPQLTARRKCRPRPLHTCAVALLSIAHKAYQKAEQFHGPIGSLARRLASLASPITCLILHQWLLILSFVDNQIIYLENTAETIFPPSRHVFDKIDSLVDISEALPRRFDDAVVHFPIMRHNVPTLNWVATYLSMVLNFLILTVGDWSFNGTKEKEILVDVNCGEPVHETAPEKPHDPKGAEVIQKQNTIEKSMIAGDNQCVEAKVRKKKKKKPRACDIEDMKEVESKCKAILGVVENMGKVEEGGKNGQDKSAFFIHESHAKGREKPVAHIHEPDTRGARHISGHVDDPILELFEAGWHIK